MQILWAKLDLRLYEVFLTDIEIFMIIIADIQYKKYIEYQKIKDYKAKVNFEANYEKNKEPKLSSKKLMNLKQQYNQEKYINSRKMEQDLFLSILPALPPQSIECISKQPIQAEIIFTQQTDCEDEDQFIAAQNPYIFQIRKDFLVQCQPKSKKICGGIILTLDYKFEIKRYIQDLENQFGIAYAFILHFPSLNSNQNRQEQFQDHNEQQIIIKLGVKNQASHILQKFAECLQNKIIYQLDINSNYRITQRVYLSHTASIYVGVSYKDNKQYAIKCIKKQLFNNTGRNLKLGVQREYMIPKIVPHKNICQYYGIFQGEDAVYVIMEKLQVNLVQFLQIKKYVKASEINSYFYQICKAVSILHGNCIMHRDIKPQNIMIRKIQQGYEPVLIDFGMAQFEEKRPYAIERCGTPGYVAPEMINKATPYDRSCDIFSLGCLFHFLMLGKPLFDGSTSYQIKINNIKCQINKQKQMYKSMNKDAKELLFKMLQKDPSKRIKINQILEHSYLKQFHKQQQQIMSHAKQIEQNFPKADDQLGSNLSNKQNFQEQNRNSQNCNDY